MFYFSDFEARSAFAVSSFYLRFTFAVSPLMERRNISVLLDEWRKRYSVTAFHLKFLPNKMVI